MEGVFSFLKQKHLSFLFVVGAAIILIGLPFSPVLMSVGTIWVSCVYLLEGDFQHKLKALSSNRLVLLALAYILYCALGLFWSEDVSSGLDHMRKILPFLVLPIVFSGMKPVRENHIRILLWIFVAAVFMSVLACLFSGYRNGTMFSVDPRSISTFTSHIRLSLFICLSLAFIFYSRLNFIVKLVVSVPLLYFLWVVQSLTGLVILIVLGFLYVFGAFSERPMSNVKWLKFTFSIVIIGAFSFIIFTVNDFYSISEPEETPDVTVAGNQYNPELENGFIENGSFLWSYVSYEELEDSWKARTGSSIWDTNSGNFPHYGVLIRYLNNLGYHKDATGISSLSESDIDRILSGNPYPDQWKYRGFSKRIRGALFHYEKCKKGSGFAGNSIAEKMVYQKAAWDIYSENLALGVGTGDVKLEFDSYYSKEYPDLPEKSRRRSPHNQYLSELLRGGPISLVLLIFILLFMWLSVGGSRKNLQRIFLVIFFLSCFSEDTLHSQAGVTFFSMFLGLLFLLNHREH